MKTTPEFTDGEIREMMDFSQVIALTEASRSRSRKIVRGILTTVLVTGLVGGALFLYNRSSSSDPIANSSAPSQPPGNVPQAAVPTPAVPLDTIQAASTDQTEGAKKKPAQKPITGEAKIPADETKKETTSTDRADSVRSVFMPAEPVDGYPALYDYFSKELRYPEESLKDSIQGVTLVTFIINAQGKPEHVSTDHALPEAFDREAIRLIENMPAWKAAQLDGSPVKSKLSVPITFTLKTIRQQ